MALATTKAGVVCKEADFLRRVEEDFTPYFQPLVPWINRLWKAVFPNNQRWDKPYEPLYSDMRGVLRDAMKDSRVMGGIDG